MRIRLTIIAKPKGGEVTALFTEFDQSGGIIGRAQDCDWILLDPDQSLSRRHAEIFFGGDSFFVRDTSLNGTYVNYSSVALGPGNDTALADGDLLNIGEYVLKVELLTEPLDISLTEPDNKDAFGHEQPLVETREPSECAHTNMHPAGFDTSSAHIAAPTSSAREYLPAKPSGVGAAEVASEDGSPLDAFPVNDEPVAVVDESPPVSVPVPARQKRIDSVDFAIFGSQHVGRGVHHIIDVWAYGAGDFQAVMEKVAHVQRDRALGLTAGLAVRGDAVIELKLSMSDVEISEPTNSIVWRGEPTNASFAIFVRPEFAATNIVGKVTLSVDGIQFGNIAFVLPLEVTGGGQYTSYDREIQRIHSAFASYASAERAEVLARLQGMHTVLPDLDIFLDVLSLRAGDDWEARLRAEVSARDIFYLFWSQQAAQSTWVSREWRMALEERGLDYIVPVPLQDPSDAAPPSELSRLHFNDAYLHHIAYLCHREELLEASTVKSE